MEKEFRKDIRIVFGETSVSVRSALRSALAAEGFSDVRECVRFTDLRAAVTADPPDLIIADAALPGGDVTDMVADLRQRRLPCSPFTPVIVTTWNPSKELVRRIIDAGADDLLTKPVAPGTIIERINVLATNRKPFIVTSDYIGPDRRKTQDRGKDDSMPYFTPPNSLGAKLEGKPIDEDAIRKTEAEILAGMNDQRLRQAAFRICFAVNRIIPELDSGIFTPEVRAEIDSIPGIAADLHRRLTSTRFISQTTLCEQVLQVARSLAGMTNEAIIREPGHKSVMLLKSAGEALMVSLNPDMMSNVLMSRVNDAIEKARQRALSRAAST